MHQLDIPQQLKFCSSILDLPLQPVYILREIKSVYSGEVSYDIIYAAIFYFFVKWSKTHAGKPTIMVQELTSALQLTFVLAIM